MPGEIIKSCYFLLTSAMLATNRKSHIKRQQDRVDRAPDFVSVILANSGKLRNIFQGEGSGEGAGVTSGLHCCC